MKKLKRHKPINKTILHYYYYYYYGIIIRIIINPSTYRYRHRAAVCVCKWTYIIRVIDAVIIVYCRNLHIASRECLSHCWRLVSFYWCNTAAAAAAEAAITSASAIVLQCCRVKSSAYDIQPGLARVPRNGANVRFQATYCHASKTRI